MVFTPEWYGGDDVGTAMWQSQASCSRFQVAQFGSSRNQNGRQ